MAELCGCGVRRMLILQVLTAKVMVHITDAHLDFRLLLVGAGRLLLK